MVQPAVSVSLGGGWGLGTDPRSCTRTTCFSETVPYGSSNFNIGLWVCMRLTGYGRFWGKVILANPFLTTYHLEVKVILAVMKQLKQLLRKAETILGFNEIWTHDLQSAIYRCDALGQERVQFYSRNIESEMMFFFFWAFFATAKISFTSILYPQYTYIMHAYTQMYFIVQYMKMPQ